jgi:hypothetical protein
MRIILNNLKTNLITMIVLYNQCKTTNDTETTKYRYGIGHNTRLYVYVTFLISTSDSADKKSSKQ